MTSADLSRNRDNFCYRHPDRVSFVMCQRCLRTICPECQTQAPVGVVCPECMKEQKANRTTAQKKADRRWGGGSVRTSPVRTGSPVTFGIIAVTVVAYVAAMVPNLELTSRLMYNPILAGEPWRLLTVSLTHANFLHLAMNMLTLYMIGRALEPLVGSGRFLALYVLSTLGGDLAVSLLTPTQFVVGASGAIFGLMGALIVIARRLGADVTSMIVMVGINFLYGFMVSGISWQAHLGGLVVGALAGLIIHATRRAAQKPLQIILLSVLGLAVVAAIYAVYFTQVFPYLR